MTLEDKWWSYDLGIFLGFMDNSPCVLAPKKNGGYQCSTPTEVITLSQDQLSKIESYGFSFIKPLPKTTTKLFDILKFSFSSLKNELQSILYLQLGLSLILMSLPILMSYFFNNFSQFIESGQITLLAILLIINTLIFFFLSINQTVLMLNLRFKIQRRLEPAIWDRLLKLTPTFFRQLNAGDIAYRAGVVSTIQEMLTQSTMLSLFSVVVAFYLLF